MKTLITYATKYGAAEVCARKLSDELTCDTDLVNLKNAKNINPDEYDIIIIGSSVYAGKIRKEARKFCEENIGALEKKQIAFYISCMNEEKKAEKHIYDNFSAELLDDAIATGVFGGAFDFEKMNFFERLIIRMISGTKDSESNFLEDNIEEFANKINEEKFG